MNQKSVYEAPEKTKPYPQPRIRIIRRDKIIVGKPKTAGPVKLKCIYVF